MRGKATVADVAAFMSVSASQGKRDITPAQCQVEAVALGSMLRESGIRESKALRPVAKTGGTRKAKSAPMATTGARGPAAKYPALAKYVQLEGNERTRFFHANRSRIFRELNARDKERGERTI
jgi:hypothetical protein